MHNSFCLSTGCDTTPASFGLGKIRCLTALEKLLQMQVAVAVLKKPDTTSEKIACVGETFLLVFYFREINTEKFLDTLK